jgi:hypothetical protein
MAIQHSDNTIQSLAEAILSLLKSRVDGDHTQFRALSALKMAEAEVKDYSVSRGFIYR